jgi:hypothetical protein
MILTLIPAERLAEALEEFRSRLAEGFARQVFDAIAATSPDRANGEVAERHCRQALALARGLGMGIVQNAAPRLSWDGERLNAKTEAFVLTHEVAHFQLASPARRRTIDFGLGAGPDTVDHAAAEWAAVLTQLAGDREEAMVSLLGILWEVALGQPALASFLDQNWLEGAGTARAARHFTAVLQRLLGGGFVTEAGEPTCQLRQEPDDAGELRVA